MTPAEPTGQLAGSRRRLGLPSKVEDDRILDEIAALLIGDGDGETEGRADAVA